MDEDYVHLSILPALRGHLGLCLPLAPGQKLLERSVVAVASSSPARMRLGHGCLGPLPPRQPPVLPPPARQEAPHQIVGPHGFEDRFHLGAGDDLAQGPLNGLEVEPVATPMRLVRRGKGLVATTDEPLPALDADTVRAVTEGLRR